MSTFCVYNFNLDILLFYTLDLDKKRGNPTD
jgi:hypothetical protein